MEPFKALSPEPAALLVMPPLAASVPWLSSTMLPFCAVTLLALVILPASEAITTFCPAVIAAPSLFVIPLLPLISIEPLIAVTVLSFSIAPAADVIATSSAAVMAALLELIMPVLPSMLMEPVVEVTELPSFTLSVPFTDCSVTSPTVSMAAKLVPIVIFLPLIKVRLFSLCIFIVL